MQHNRTYLFLLILTALALLLPGCGDKPGADEQTRSANPDQLFSKLPATATGIAFSNTLQEDTVFNILNYLYYFNGGGVAAGDLNGDSLPDLYFTANQQRNHLYLNQGDLQFKEVAEASGAAGTDHWSTGVSMADVNGDGLLDIYLCYAGNFPGREGRNQLLVNKGNNAEGVPQFKDEAVAWGVAFSGFSTQASFFDYDLDGDLDLYLLNHSIHTESNYREADRVRQLKDPKAGDRLYRNDGGRFTDVSAEAGIWQAPIGYGLSASIADLDLNGYPDIYVCNDFHEDDYLYLNQGDGTFRECLRQSVNHTARFSMGSDIADFNNDGLPDIISLDMKPEFEEIRKTAQPEDTYDIFEFKLQYGYYYQFARNALQVHQGFDAAGNPRFSEVAQLAGVDATDWSWSALFSDLDLDGHKDLFITNGIYRRPNDMDYIKFISDSQIKRSLATGVTDGNLKVILEMPQVPQANYAFRNSGGLQFEKASENWGLGDKTFSNGVAWADLDNDGDPELVVNNVNAPASIYRNSATEKGKNYLKIRLAGEGGNRFGVGSQVVVHANGQQQHQTLIPARGFQSSVEPVLLFGLNAASQADSVAIYWPDGRYQLLTGIPANQTLVLEQRQAEQQRRLLASTINPKKNRLLKEVPGNAGIDFTHRENPYTDFNREPLMLRMLSREGPRLATADVNADGLEDFYVCGAAGQPGALYLQQASGQFRPASQPVFAKDAAFEDADAVFLFFNDDELPDLLVGSGGGEHRPGHELLADRLYVNQGNGRFEAVAEPVLNGLRQNTGCLAKADFDADGDDDLFLGSRSVPGSYGLKPESFVLENTGNGFQKLPLPEVLAKAGMLTNARFADMDGTGQPELLLAGDWMPLKIFRWMDGRWQPLLASSGTADSLQLAAHHGLWNTLEVADLNGDGLPDIVAGNLGLNGDFTASPARPLELFVKDFDRSGNTDPVLVNWRPGLNGEQRRYTFAGRDALVDQMSYIRKLFPSYKAFSEASFEQVFSESELKNALHLKATTLESSYFENLGDGRFRRVPMPEAAQVFPVCATALLKRASEDRGAQLLLAGNLHGVQADQGNYDAGYGIMLDFLPDSRQGFTTRPELLPLAGEVRYMQLIKTEKKLMLLVARNNGKLKVYQLQAYTPGSVTKSALQ